MQRVNAADVSGILHALDRDTVIVHIADRKFTASMSPALAEAIYSPCSILKHCVPELFKKLHPAT